MVEWVYCKILIIYINSIKEQKLFCVTERIEDVSFISYFLLLNIYINI